MKSILTAAALTLALGGVAQAGSPYRVAPHHPTHLTVHGHMLMQHGHMVRRAMSVPKRFRQVRVRHVDQYQQAVREGYETVTKLTNNAFPPFYPSLGKVLVKASTLPIGPYRCFDHQNRLVSTVYMPLLSDMDSHKTWDNVKGLPAPVDHMTMYYHKGHPGVDVPHYHVVLWHVRDESVVAK